MDKDPIRIHKKILDVDPDSLNMDTEHSGQEYPFC